MSLVSGIDKKTLAKHVREWVSACDFFSPCPDHVSFCQDLTQTKIAKNEIKLIRISQKFDQSFVSWDAYCANHV